MGIVYFYMSVSLDGFINVEIGTASPFQQALKAGLLDEIHIDLAPVLLGSETACPETSKGSISALPRRDPEVSMAQDLVQQVAQQSGYQIISHRLDFFGVCPDCREGKLASVPLGNREALIMIDSLDPFTRNDAHE